MSRVSSPSTLRGGVGLLIFVTCCSDADGRDPTSSSRFRSLLAPGAETIVQSDAASIDFVAQELLGRPSSHSITVKAIAKQSVEAYAEYGTTPGDYGASSAATTFTDGVIEAELDGLAPNTKYYYRLRYREAGSSDDFLARPEHSFVTQRSAASTFTFDVQSDSHQGYAAFYTSALYGITLQNIANDHPDLLFDLGDAVSEDDQSESESTVRQKYQDQRTYFDIAGHSSSVFLVLGNHEREEGWYLDDFGSDVASTRPVLGANARKRFFSNPVPNDFYSGNGEVMPELDGDHLRGDYYAFEWGSALFVALDPFWYTLTKPYAGAQGGEVDDATETVGTRWDWTLGKAQYDWLAQTLAASSKPFKFVFAHHPTGGTSDYVRGGARAAKYCEWGGYDLDGTTYAFDTKRPGWAMPVHQLLVANGVTAFVHGHDHVFAREELDGVVYQEIPQAADAGYGTGFASNAKDYAGATTFHNSGHVRFTVSPVAVTVEYVRAYLAGDGDNGSVAYAYTISPCAALNSDGRACDDGLACTLHDVCSGGTCAGTPDGPDCAAAGAAGSGAGGNGGGAAAPEGGAAGERTERGAMAGEGGEPAPASHGDDGHRQARRTSTASGTSSRRASFIFVLRRAGNRSRRTGSAARAGAPPGCGRSSGAARRRARRPRRAAPPSCRRRCRSARSRAPRSRAPRSAPRARSSNCRWSK